MAVSTVIAICRSSRHISYPEITLVANVIHLARAYHSLVHVERVESASQMYDICNRIFPDTDIAVLAAAVADYRPVETADSKIKKKEESFSLALTKTADILAGLGKIKRPHQTLVGFALETNNELEHALEKLEGKNADMIVLNSLRDQGAGFAYDTNKVTILKKETAPMELPLMSKTEVAEAIVNQIVELKHAEKTV